MSAGAVSLDSAKDAVDQRRAGVLFALGCFGIWGFAALYFRQLDGVPPLEILLHRSAWSVVFLLPIVLWSGRLSSIARALTTLRAWLTLLLSATLRYDDSARCWRDWLAVRAVRYRLWLYDVRHRG